MAEHKQPEVLLSTDWVAQHTDDAQVRLIEVDVDTRSYDKGHIKNAVDWNWQSQLQCNVRRDLLGQKKFGDLSTPGESIAPHTATDSCCFWNFHDCSLGY